MESVATREFLGPPDESNKKDQFLRTSLSRRAFPCCSDARRATRLWAMVMMENAENPGNLGRLGVDFKVYL